MWSPSQLVELLDVIYTENLDGGRKYLVPFEVYQCWSSTVGTPMGNIIYWDLTFPVKPFCIKFTHFVVRIVTVNSNISLVFLGERDYGPPIDLWGGGCIMAEMWTRSPIMQGNTEQHQLTLISQLCGSITPEVSTLATWWPNYWKKLLFSRNWVNNIIGGITCDPQLQVIQIRERPMEWCTQSDQGPGSNFF